MQVLENYLQLYIPEPVNGVVRHQDIKLLDSSGRVINGLYQLSMKLNLADRALLTVDATFTVRVVTNRDYETIAHEQG